MLQTNSACWFYIQSSSGRPCSPPARCLHRRAQGFYFQASWVSINQLVGHPHDARMMKKKILPCLSGSEATGIHSTGNSTVFQMYRNVLVMQLPNHPKLVVKAEPLGE